MSVKEDSIDDMAPQISKSFNEQIYKPQINKSDLAFIRKPQAIENSKFQTTRRNIE